MARWVDEWGPERMGGLGSLIYALKRWTDEHGNDPTRHMTAEDWEEIRRYRAEFDSLAPPPAAARAGEEGT
jgi:hypothetical protein